jgi:predicted nucleic acid-binding protein
MPEEGAPAAAVVDASVVTKWFVEEDYSDVALRLRDDYTSLQLKVVVPQIAAYEVLNALKYSHSFGTKDLTEVAEALRGYQLIEHAFDAPLARETIRLAMDSGITIYDAVYVAIGEVRKLPVYTADEVLLRKLPGNAYLRHITGYRLGDKAKRGKAD